jgi:hypothetical protein
MELSTVFVVMRQIIQRTIFVTPIAIYPDPETAHQHVCLAEQHKSDITNVFDKGLSFAMQDPVLSFAAQNPSSYDGPLHIAYYVLEMPFALHVDQYQDRGYKFKPVSMSQTIDKG